MMPLLEKVYLCRIILWFYILGSGFCFQCPYHVAECPAIEKANSCFRGCNCTSTLASCTSGFPNCIFTVIMDGLRIGQSVEEISAMSLQYNCGQYVEAVIIKDLPSLRVIRAGAFQLFEEKMKEIHIRANPSLTTIEEGVINDKLSHLHTLSVCDNPSLSNISFLVQKNLPELVLLELDHNNISVIPCGTFNYVTKLKVLDLRGNQLVSIDECMLGVITQTTHFVYVLLRDNPLNCSCSSVPLLDGSVNVFLDFSAHDVTCEHPWSGYTLHNTVQFLRKNEENRTSCPNAKAKARADSPCVCDTGPKPPCPPDCKWWKKHPVCENDTSRVVGFPLEIEGCLCDLITQGVASIDSAWAQYCVVKGDLTEQVQNMSWIGVVAFVLVIIIGLVPCLLSAFDCCAPAEGEEIEKNKVTAFFKRLWKNDASGNKSSPNQYDTVGRDSSGKEKY